MQSVTRDQFVNAVRANPQWRDVPVIGHMLCGMQYLNDENKVMAVATYGKINQPKVKVLPTYRVNINGI